ncbi:MAG: hypothetical protein AB8F65_06505 [Woeseiaceae bacterium]
MRFTIIVGFLLGLVGSLALAYTAPFLQQERVRGITEVMTNGGRLERFEIHLDDDILMQAPGTASLAETIPGTADWYPELAPFAGLAAVYRLRNERAEVIGIASRVRGIASEEQVEWVLYLPARGMMGLDGASVDTVELGDIIVVDREFAGLVGEWKAYIDEDNIWRFETRLRTPDDEDEDDVDSEDSGASS